MQKKKKKKKRKKKKQNKAINTLAIPVVIKFRYNKLTVSLNQKDEN